MTQSASKLLGVILSVSYLTVCASDAGVPDSAKGALQPKITVAGKVMVLIPGGGFKMGCVPSDDQCKDCEKPQHDVVLDAFYMDETEVTNAEYRQCVKAGICKRPEEREAFDDPARANEPVLFVYLRDARRYAKWAGKRLPTEAEWERAARGGLSDALYPNGNSFTHEDGNFAGMEGRDKWARLSPVKCFPPNGYGLYDMAGNAWEMCEDMFNCAYYQKSPANNPTGASSSDPVRTESLKWGGSGRTGFLSGGVDPSPGIANTILHVKRGGCFLTGSPADLRVSLRSGYSPVIAEGVVGFRCVKSAG